MMTEAVAAQDRRPSVPDFKPLHGMERRLRFVASYLIFWVIFFGVARLFFLAYQGMQTEALPGGYTLAIALHGLKLDLSLASWFTILPALVMSRSGFLPPIVTRRIIAVYTGLLLVLSSFIITANLGIFARWGAGLDASLLPYLSTPDVAKAATEGSPLAWLLLIVVLMSATATVAFVNLVLPVHDDAPVASGEQSLALLIVTLLLLIPMRGGFQKIPITQSSVYFSRSDFANQAAVNPVWSFAATLTNSVPHFNEFRYVSDAEEALVVDSLLGRGSESEEPVPRLLRSRPRIIILLIWEGLTAKVVEPLGGRPGVTMGFNRLSRRGILFTGIYATGTRTPVGLPAILSGEPALSRTMVIQSSDKTADLPGLGRTLSRAGYYSAFLYGGNPDFMNMRRYLIATGFDTMIVRSQFADRTIDHGWGIHDHRVLARGLSYLDSLHRPAFLTILTLSSHEPFDVPMERVIPGDDIEHQFLNSHVYADRSVTHFIEEARKRPWWNDALVIITADHGNHFPVTDLQSDKEPAQFHIPMLWLGGTLAVSDTVIRSIGSQTDIARLLLDELHLPSKDFLWSKNFLVPGVPHFAFYAFDKGFGYIDESGSFGFDNVQGSIVYQSNRVSKEEVRAGRVFQQAAVQGYLKLGTTARVRAAARNSSRGIRSP